MFSHKCKVCKYFMIDSYQLVYNGGQRCMCSLEIRSNFDLLVPILCIEGRSSVIYLGQTFIILYVLSLLLKMLLK